MVAEVRFLTTNEQAGLTWAQEALAQRFSHMCSSSCICCPTVQNNPYHTTSSRPPSIGYTDYIRRHTKYIESMTISTIVLAAVNIDRWLLDHETGIRQTVCIRSAHHLLAVALHTSDKYLTDPPDYVFKYRAQVSGTSPSRLLRLERHFLDRLGWQPACSDKTFVQYLKVLLQAELKPIPEKKFRK